MKRILGAILFLTLTSGLFAATQPTATQCVLNAIATQTMQAYPINAVATVGQANAIATATPGISNAVATSTALITTANAVATSLALTAVANATATGTVAGSIATATAIKSGLNQGATATVTVQTGTYNSTTQSVDAAYGSQSTAVATAWSAGIATVQAQVTSNCKACNVIASYTATLTPTLTPTATMPVSNGVYFQSTPATGKRQIIFVKSNIQDVYIDSITSTLCSVDFYVNNTYTAFRHVYLADISKPIHFFGKTVTALYVDYGINTGNSTVVTTGMSGVVISQVTPGTGVVAVATKINVDKIVIDSLVNTDCVIKIADGSTVLENVSITALPATLNFYGRLFMALRINYGTKTGTSYVVTGGSGQGVIYQSTPQAGTYTVPTPTILEKRRVDHVTVDYLYGLPSSVNIYNGTVLYKTQDIYSTPWDINLGGAVLSNMKIGYGLSTGTAKIVNQ